jgi:hypothetical protein
MKLEEGKPNGTRAVIWVAESTVNSADTPPKDTPVLPVKLIPVMVTSIMGVNEAGENDVIAGPAGNVVKLSELTAVPPAVTIVTGPDANGPVGVVAVICVAESTV